MKKKQVFLLALMMMALFMLCGCGAIQETSISSSGDSVTDLTLRPDGEAGQLYENDGLKLLIPLEYDELLITETPQDDTGVQLFSVSEKASVEAAKAAGMDYEGGGWLFSIERIDEATLRDLLCNTDLSGTEVFARDDLGRYYLYRHPTDVRYVREDNDAMAADQEIWTGLNEWAWTRVRETFLHENPELIAETRGILCNLTYTGVLRSGESRSEVQEHLQIITQAQFEAARSIRESRANAAALETHVPMNTRGSTA